MMRTIKIFLVLVLLLTGSGILAQPGRDKIEALRVAFISKRVDLSNSESEKFWPVYNEYNDKIKAIRKNLRQNYHNYRESDEKEAEEVFQLDQRSRQAEAEVHRIYSEKIKAIIGAKKTVRLRIAEEEFKKEMIRAID